MEGSKFIDRPGVWHEQKLEAQERIMALQDAKKDLAEAILEGKSESLMSMSAEELMALLG